MFDDTIGKKNHRRSEACGHLKYLGGILNIIYPMHLQGQPFLLNYPFYSGSTLEEEYQLVHSQESLPQLAKPRF